MTLGTTSASRRPVWLRPARRSSENVAFDAAERNGAQATAIVQSLGSCSGMGMQISASTPVNESSFDSWLQSATPGEHLVYHVGHLGFDRSFGSDLPRPRRQSLERVANRAMALAECGRLVLAQRRLGHGCIAYLAIMAAPAHQLTQEQRP
jgi:hypothetical protein